MNWWRMTYWVKADVTLLNFDIFQKQTSAASLDPGSNAKNSYASLK
jgi:hypothetical protein